MGIKNRQVRRILMVEKMIMMPVKTAFLILIFLFFWGPEQEFQLLTKSFYFYQSVLYIFGNVIFFLILTWAQRRQWALASIKISAFLLAIIDNLFLSFLIPITGGLESPLYWLYSGLMVRNAIDFPRIREQGVINFAFCIFYGGMVYFSERESNLFSKEIFYLKIIVLVLVSICCWGIYALIQQRLARLDEERELQLRREKIHAIRRLAGEIAHGLKNPLSIMNNSAYYLEKHIRDDQVDLKRTIEVIREEVVRSDKILSQIMDYSKLSNVKLAKLNLNTVLNHVINEIHLDTAFPGIQIKQIFQKNIPLIFFDEGHLRQIFLNLITNAMEAVMAKKQGQGVIRVSTQFSEEELLIVSITDNGVGMDPQEAEKIFHPFFTTKEKGTGLGLSIVKNLVETYDGSIEVESEKGGGSIFTVKFPVRITVG